MIALRDIEKSYTGELVLRKLSFDLPEQHTLSVLGKSGSGKSTLLKIMAGLETADAGTFMVNGHNMMVLPPQKRDVVYLSQEPLLFPHLNVAQNLGYGLQIRKLKRSEIDNKVTTLAEKLGLEDHLLKMPHQLSGGQKQRVNFGRGLIINPGIMLLDEPFGSLDTQTRSEMQDLFKTVSKAYKITSLFVTHDLKEALMMGDQVGIMDAGVLKVYPSIQAFLQSPESGATKELDFWERITNIYNAGK